MRKDVSETFLLSEINLGNIKAIMENIFFIEIHMR